MDGGLDFWREVDSGQSFGSVELSSDLVIRAADALVLERLGFQREELVGRNVIDLVHPAELERAADALDDYLRSPSARAQAMYRVRASEGYTTLGLLVDSSADGDGVALHVFEVSDALRASELSKDLVRAIRLVGAEVSLEEMIGAASQMITRQLPRVSVGATVFSPCGAPTAIGSEGFPPDILQSNRRAHPLSLPAHVNEAVRSHKDSAWLVETRNGFHDAGRPERVVLALLDDGQLLGYLEILRPWAATPTPNEWLVYASAAQVISAGVTRHRLDESLRRAADHDPLTGLLNRRGFSEELRIADQPGGAVFVIDLDEFSLINNSRGHAVGDAALRAVGKCLVETLPNESIVGRLGGDEFVGWLPDVHRDDALDISEVVRAQIARAVSAQNDGVSGSASVGVVMIDPGEDIEQAIRRADAAMYEAKSAGGNQVKCSSPSFLG